MFDRQKGDLLVSTSTSKLSAIGVLFPADAAQQLPIGGMERNEITAAAMVRPENKPLRRQLRESTLDVGWPKLRAISPDGHNFVITKLRNPFDCVLKTRREILPRLSVNAGSRNNCATGGSKKMHIDR
jgi:hypothetical protein